MTRTELTLIFAILTLLMIVPSLQDESTSEKYVTAYPQQNIFELYASERSGDGKEENPKFQIINRDLFPVGASQIAAIFENSKIKDCDISQMQKDEIVLALSPKCENFEINQFSQGTFFGNKEFQNFKNFIYNSWSPSPKFKKILTIFDHQK